MESLVLVCRPEGTRIFEQRTLGFWNYPCGAAGHKRRSGPDNVTPRLREEHIGDRLDAVPCVTVDQHLACDKQFTGPGRNPTPEGRGPALAGIVATISPSLSFRITLRALSTAKWLRNRNRICQPTISTRLHGLLDIDQF